LGVIKPTFDVEFEDFWIPNVEEGALREACESFFPELR
jgi:hypothetical protein